MRLGIMVSIVLAGILRVVACTNNHAVQSVPRTQQLSTIEANIEKLKQAQQRLLADPTDKAALSVIMTLIKDSNGINRVNAASMLGDVGEEHGEIIKDSVVPLLIHMVESGDGFDQYAALKALRGFGPHATAAIPSLRTMLQSPDAQKTWVAAEALGRMKAAAANAVQDLVDVIKRHKPECLDDELHICRYGLQALGNIGPGAAASTEYLVTLLNDANPYIRAYAAVALLKIDPNRKEATAVIAKLLTDPAVEVRRRTIWELRDAGRQARPAQAFVKKALGDRDDAVRQASSELMTVLRQE
jgi:HEAT repeat protein